MPEAMRTRERERDEQKCEDGEMVEKSFHNLWFTGSVSQTQSKIMWQKFERVSLTIQQQAFIRWLLLIQWMHWFYFTKMSQMHAFFKRGAEPFNVNEIKLHIKQIDFNYLFRTINFNYHFLLFQPTFCQYAHIFSVQFILGVFEIELKIEILIEISWTRICARMSRSMV